MARSRCFTWLTIPRDFLARRSWKNIHTKIEEGFSVSSLLSKHKFWCFAVQYINVDTRFSLKTIPLSLEDTMCLTRRGLILLYHLLVCFYFAFASYIFACPFPFNLSQSFWYRCVFHTSNMSENKESLNTVMNTLNTCPPSLSLCSPGRADMKADTSHPETSTVPGT